MEPIEPTAQNRYLIPFAIVIAGVFVAAAIYFGGGSARPTAGIRDEPDVSQIDVAPVTEKDHIIGSRNATLVVVEYSDTECPFCKTFHNTMKEVVHTYGGEVSWVYRHLPIAQLHSKAPKEAEATECANELGGNQVFWNYLDKVFETTRSNDTLDPSELPKIATAVGLNVAAFNTCLSSGRYTEAIKNSVAEGVKAGALGTPYSVIIARDGRQVVISGAEPLATVKARIDALLK